MRKCPTCGRTYSETDTEFCEDDGTKLIQAVDMPTPSGGKQQPTPPPGPVVKQNVVTCSSCNWSGEAPADGFCPNCGSRLETSRIPPKVAASPILELVFLDSTTMQVKTFPFNLGFKDFKRYPDDVTKHISTAHLAIYSENGQFQIEDTNSLNGTSLNGEIIGMNRKGMGKKPLKNRDVVQLAPDEKGEGVVKFTVRVVLPDEMRKT